MTPTWGLFVDVGNGMWAVTLESVMDWEMTALLDKAGTFLFHCAASDPHAGALTDLTYVHCYSYENSILIEHGGGFITQVTYKLDALDTLEIAGQDYLGELAGYRVGSLVLARVWTRDATYVWHVITAGYGGSSFSITPLPGVCHLGFGDWLYFGDTTPFDTATLTLGTVKNVSGFIEWEYYHDNGTSQSWDHLSFVQNGDETMDTAARSLTQTGRIKFDPPREWGLFDTSYYVVRCRMDKGPEIDLDVTSLTVAGPSSDPDGLAKIMATIPGGAGWALDVTAGYAATLTSVVQDMSGKTVLDALGTLCSVTDEHFRLGSGNNVVWLQNVAPVSGITALQTNDPISSELDDTLAYIVSMTSVTDAANLWSRIYPYGQAVGQNRLDLTYATGSVPSGYTLDTANNCIINTGMESWVGRHIDSPDQTNADIRAFAPTVDQVEQAANQLLKWALMLAETHSASAPTDIPLFLNLTLAKLNGALFPGDMMSIDVDPIRDSVHYVNLVRSDLRVMAITRHVDSSGVLTAALQAATVTRYPDSDQSALKRILSNSQRQFINNPTAIGMTAVSSGA